ncbi:MAG: homoserine dehydrogenase, partial [Oscillospiraceae bacterium]|nr:homoserine dehydrogenase [Oscillospiraceae bacterium]
EKVHTEGISSVSLEDIRTAKKLGYKIKLIARAKAAQDALEAVVAPMLVSPASPLYNIDDVFNGIIVTGNAVGDVMFCGRGAGKLPTASAIAADVIDALSKSTKNILWEKSDGGYVAPYKTQKFRYCISTSSGAAEITNELNEAELDKYISDSGLDVKSKIKLL